MSVHIGVFLFLFTLLSISISNPVQCDAYSTRKALFVFGDSLLDPGNNQYLPDASLNKPATTDKPQGSGEPLEGRQEIAEAEAGRRRGPEDHEQSRLPVQHRRQRLLQLSLIKPSARKATIRRHHHLQPNERPQGIRDALFLDLSVTLLLDF